MLHLEAGRFTGDLDAKMARQIREAALAGTGYSKGVTAALFRDAGKVTATGINNLFTRINARAVEAIWQRTYKGLKLSNRIWNTGQNYRTQLTRLVQESVATGQDAVKTARMLERYINQGASTLIKDYPEAWDRLKGRMPKNISYEALRLARTETTAAFGQGSITAARLTPSYAGIKYCLSAQHRIYDICDLLAAADEDGLGPGVYAPGNEPVYPAHPNTRSFLVPVHAQPGEMIEKIKAWEKDPDSQPELERWYNDVYKGFIDRPSGGPGGGKVRAESPLPGLESAYIHPAKLLNYALNKNHPGDGKNKAIAFEEALGYNQDNAGELQSSIIENLPYYNATNKGRNDYGERYEVVMELTGPNGKTARVGTGWLIGNNKAFPSLTSAYVTRKISFSKAIVSPVALFTSIKSASSSAVKMSSSWPSSVIVPPLFANSAGSVIL